MSTEKQLEALVRRFVDDLTQLARKAALDALAQALDDPRRASAAGGRLEPPGRRRRRGSKRR